MDWTWVSCIAGRFFTKWTTREVLLSNCLLLMLSWVWGDDWDPFLLLLTPTRDWPAKVHPISGLAGAGLSRKPYFSLLIREGIEESTGKQMLWCNNPSFSFSLYPFYLGKIGFQLVLTKRRQKTITESLWSLTVTLEHGIKHHLSYPRLCRSKGPLRSRNGCMPRYSLLRMPRSAWGRPPAKQETQWGVQPAPRVGAQGRPSNPSHRVPTLLRKELPRVGKLTIDRKPGAALMFSPQRVGKVAPEGEGRRKGGWQGKRKRRGKGREPAAQLWGRYNACRGEVFKLSRELRI